MLFASIKIGVRAIYHLPVHQTFWGNALFLT